MPDDPTNGRDPVVARCVSSWACADRNGTIYSYHDTRVDAAAAVARMKAEEDAWAECPAQAVCRRHDTTPCLACWSDAGDVVAGLRLSELADNPPLSMIPATTKQTTPTR